MLAATARHGAEVGQERTREWEGTDMAPAWSR